MLVKLTKPVRVAIVELEVTVTVQEVDAPVGMLAEQSTAMLVGNRVDVTITSELAVVGSK